jgi:sugar phosphate isomerase/epimerase
LFVAASTHCFPDLELSETLDRLSHLEFTAVELHLKDDGMHLPSAEAIAHWQRAASLCRDEYRLDICSFFLDPGPASDVTYKRFQSLCKLAKGVKVVSITVPSSELGTPFNEEIEHLRKLVGIAGMEGVRVSTKNQVGCISQDPDTLRLMCTHVEGLGITLDPSHFVFGPHAGVDYESLLKFVYHVQLRDTTKDKLQVRVGQGEVEYGKLIGQLRKAGYNRALCIDIPPTDDPTIDHHGELRKLRLLLESLLI